MKSRFLSMVVMRDPPLAVMIALVPLVLLVTLFLHLFAEALSHRTEIDQVERELRAMASSIRNFIRPSTNSANRRGFRQSAVIFGGGSNNTYLPGLNSVPPATQPADARSYRTGEVVLGWMLTNGQFVLADSRDRVQLDCGDGHFVPPSQFICVESSDGVIRFVPSTSDAASSTPQTQPADDVVRSIWTTTEGDWHGNWVGNANERPAGGFWTRYLAEASEAASSKAPVPAGQDLFPSKQPTTQPTDSATPASAPRAQSDDDLDAGIAEWQRFIDIQSGKTKQKVFTTDDGIFPDAESTTRPASKTEAMS